MKPRLIAMLPLLLLLAGCAHVEVVAPPGSPVFLASSSEPVQVKRQWRTWYLAWGLTPLDNTMPAEIIQRERLDEVRVTVEDNISDTILSGLYTVYMPIALVPQTVVMEGNRTPPPNGGK
jgi:hypothetical protein